jgi:hypothetical protein
MIFFRVCNMVLKYLKKMFLGFLGFWLLYKLKVKKNILELEQNGRTTAEQMNHKIKTKF